MECTDTSLAYLMSYVPENKFAAYFPVAKNHVLSEIILELLVHMYEKKPKSHHGHIMKIQPFCNLEKSLKAQCLLLKVHGTSGPG